MYGVFKQIVCSTVGGSQKTCLTATESRNCIKNHIYHSKYSVWCVSACLSVCVMSEKCITCQQLTHNFGHIVRFSKRFNNDVISMMVFIYDIYAQVVC